MKKQTSFRRASIAFLTFDIATGPSPMQSLMSPTTSTLALCMGMSKMPWASRNVKGASGGGASVSVMVSRMGKGKDYKGLLEKVTTAAFRRRVRKGALVV